MNKISIKDSYLKTIAFVSKWGILSPTKSQAQHLQCFGILALLINLILAVLKVDNFQAHTVGIITILAVLLEGIQLAFKLGVASLKDILYSVFWAYAMALLIYLFN